MVSGKMKSKFIRTRTVSDKINSAKLGHLGCQYEVAEWYRTGKYSLDVNEDMRQSYIENITRSLSNIRPYFSEIELINFKGIKNIKGNLELHPHLNVFVGVNGSGKTTIIDAIIKASSWITNGIRTGGNGKHLDLDEINNNPTIKDCFVSTELTIGEKSKFNIQLFKSKNSLSKIRSDLAEFKILAEMYRYCNEEDYDNFNLPLFSHYSISRALEIKKEDCKRDSDEVTFVKKLDGYNEESKNFKSLLEWLTQYDQMRTYDNKNLTEYISKTAEYNAVKKVFDSLNDELKAHGDIGKPMELELQSLKKIINKLHEEQKSNDDIAVKVVKDAIYQFMDIENIRVEVTKEKFDILMEKNNVTISATELSQGEKALFSLVSDISKRLILLNPGREYDALKGHGVVTIDEIDLHLHPRWQQDIVVKLTKVFPNIQFILTTHSPQVLSTVPNYCIKVLNNDSDGNLHISEPEFSLGSESKMILEDIFLVDSRPEGIEIVQVLNRFKELIKQDKWDTDESKELEQKLIEWAGEHDPIIKQLQMDIRLRKRRRG